MTDREYLVAMRCGMGESHAVVTRGDIRAAQTFDHYVRRAAARASDHRAALGEIAATVALARVPWALHYAAPQLRAIVTHHRKART